jgi:hypothetical protein
MKPQHDLRAALSAWQTPAPANDNSLIEATSFTDLAARRAFVQREQVNPEPVLNLPSLERLGRSAPDAVRLWKFWRDLQTESRVDLLVDDEGGEDDDNTPPGVPNGFSTEQDLEVRPSVNELQRAWESAPARRLSVHCVVRHGERCDVVPVIEPVVSRKGHRAWIGPLEFRKGQLVCWGTTARGASLRPREELRAEKGIRRRPPARNLRHLVRTEAPIAKNAGFLAGACHSTGKSGAPLECYAEREQSRQAEQSLLRQVLGAHAEILDMAIGDATAREIGESRGYSGKHAERRGIFLVSEALSALRTIAGENIQSRAA